MPLSLHQAQRGFPDGSVTWRGTRSVLEACVPADSPHQHAWSLEAGNRGASSSDPADETKGAPKIASGETNRDDEVVKEIYARTGAYVLGWQMFDEGEVGWPDPPPFRAPVFGLTTHARKAWVRQGGTTRTVGACSGRNWLTGLYLFGPGGNISTWRSPGRRSIAEGRILEIR